LVYAVNQIESPEHLDKVIPALKKIQHDDLYTAIIDLYLRIPDHSRSILTPLFIKHRTDLKKVLQTRKDIGTGTRIVLETLLKCPAKSISEKICTLDHSNRINIIYKILNCKSIVQRLPWEQWLSENPEQYTDLVAEIVVRIGGGGLTDAVFTSFKDNPTPTLIRAMGELRIKKAVPHMLRILDRGSNLLRAHVLENLGKIGGIQARDTLKKIAHSNKKEETRIAYRALSLCATQKDVRFFIDAVTNPDWYIRLACVEVFRRFPTPANKKILSRLMYDPKSTIAEKARKYLNY